jgi:cell fate (sporulation/competence/biofilm development) regulator YmcA (YheA/YmcA/DUF963 family)
MNKLNKMNVYFQTQKYLNELEERVETLPLETFQHFEQLKTDLLRFVSDTFEDERSEFLTGIANKTIDPVSGAQIFDGTYSN